MQRHWIVQASKLRHARATQLASEFLKVERAGMFLNACRWAMGTTSYCATHGGGESCTYEGCDSLALGQTSHCKKHGGGRQCQHPLCNKPARGNTPMCIAHGGGKRCTFADCRKSALGSSKVCCLISLTGYFARR